MEVVKFDGKFKSPTTIMVSAPTKAGKTTLVNKILQFRKEMFDIKPEKNFWCFSEAQPSYSLKYVQYIKGIPDMKLFQKDKSHKLLIIDDMMSESKNLVDIFSKGSHHWNMTIIFILQDIFFDKKRTNRINSQYIILMKSPGDKLTGLNLAKQMYPKKTDFFMDAYSKATENPHGYLLIDLEQNTPECLRLRTNILPNELNIFYTPKINKKD